MLANSRLIYKNFSISSIEYTKIVDRFLEGLNEPDNLILVHFWKKYYNNICFPIKEEKDLESMLSIFADKNSNYYITFHDYLEKNIKPYETFLSSKECQDKINNGYDIFNIDIGSHTILDISGLHQFSFWVNLIQNLFKTLIRNVISQIDTTINRIDKALIVKKLYILLIKYKHLYCDKYSICKACSKFYFNSLKKLLEFVNEGAEFAIYTFDILCPEMMTDTCILLVNKSGSFYKNAKLEIDDNDVVFSDSRKKLIQYYLEK